VARKKSGGGHSIALTVVAVLVVALIGGLLWTQFGPRPTQKRRKGLHVVRVQVMNGSGEPGVGTRVAQFLREGGFQVVDVRNADRSDYFSSMVVARRADLSLAREVAHYLGGPPLIQQAWDSELADVTVLIGSDRSRLQLEP